MPIAATTTLLSTQIKMALNMGPAAMQDTVSQIINTAIASIAPSGLFPAGPAMIPLVPAGVAMAINQTSMALKMDVAATQDSVSGIIATAISMACPMVPPVGLSILQSQIKMALSMDVAATQDSVSNIIANAIISYYMMGGVV